MSKVSKLEEVSHETLVLLRPRVSSRVSGFPLASPCLWGKLQHRVSSRVSAFPLASPCLWGRYKTSLVLLRSCRRVYGGSCKTSVSAFPLVAVSMGKAAKPRLFCCAHVAASIGGAAKPQSLLFLLRRRVYGGSCKTSLALLRPRRHVYAGSCKTLVSSRVSAFPRASPCLWGKLQNLSFCCVESLLFLGLVQALSYKVVLCKLCSTK